MLYDVIYQNFINKNVELLSFISKRIKKIKCKISCEQFKAFCDNFVYRIDTYVLHTYRYYSMRVYNVGSLI